MGRFRKAVIAAGAALALGGCGGGGGSPGEPVFGGGADGGSGPASGEGVPLTSNQPSQRYFILAAEDTELNWIDEQETTSLTVTVADAARNPAGFGSRVQFTTEAGTVASSCTIPASTDISSSLAQCSVTLQTILGLPVGSHVTVLAWMEGEEAYVDVNGNGRYDSGEPFWDSGRPFLDVDDDGVYTRGRDELVVGTYEGTSLPGIGSSACISGPSDILHPNSEPFSVPDTCDGKWGKALIRVQLKLPVASSSP